MEIILKVKDNLYTESEDGKTRKLVKKNILTSLHIDSNDIIGISDVLNNKGNILKNYCRIHIKEIGPVVVNHSRDYISNIKQPKFKQIGFKQRNRG